jgi:hypothetical protein
MLPEIGRTVQHGYFTVIGPAVNPTSWLSDFIKRLDRQVLVSYALARHRLTSGRLRAPALAGCGAAAAPDDPASSVVKVLQIA